MSIARLEKVTLISLAGEVEAMISWLQGLGCAHLIPAAGADGSPEEGAGGLATVSPEALHAVRFLEQSPRRRRPVSRSRREVAKFDPAGVGEEALRLRDRLEDLRLRREQLRQRIRVLEPWGQFEYPPLAEMGGLRLWFYKVPLRELPKLKESAACWEVVRRDERHAHVVILSEEEPVGVPAPRSHVGERSLNTRLEELEELDLAIEDVEMERERLSRWTDLLRRNLDGLHDLAARKQAREMVCEGGTVRALQAWVPLGSAPALEREAAERGYVCLREAPTDAEEPPTLLQNRPFFQAGEPLVTFYATPGYHGWDPSAIVLVSFSVFFAMILADAGYALVLAALLGLFWRRLGRTGSGRRARTLGALLSLTSLGYGMVVGSYFGMSPPEDSWLARVDLLDAADPATMMRLCVGLGVFHVVLGCLLESRRHGWRREALPPLGWAGFVSGGALAAGAHFAAHEPLFRAGLILAGLGLLVVLAFAGPARARPLARVLGGVTSLAGITAAFGDVLSYLRLFALGLAGSSLAATFNELASQVREAVPGAGLLLALLIALPGHALNFLLGMIGGVIHGLRLNVIEFFNWSLKTEGRLFTPFRLRSSNPCNNP